MGNATSSVARTSQEEQIHQIDGGSLVLENGVYTAPQDWKKSVVRALQLSRRLAPYYKGLDDYDPEWTNDELLQALRLALPQNAYNQALLTSINDPSGTSNSHSKSSSTRGTPSRPSSFVENSASAATLAKPIRPRAITMDSSTTIPRRRVPFAVTLYQNAVECPICFLYYPSNISTTRCCRQPICTECFVQIRRPNPHAPIVHADDPNPPPENPETLIMESPVCPYCNVSDFGIIYFAPDFSAPRQPYVPWPASDRDIPPTDSRVVLTDLIRPDWTAKLQRAKDRAARRAANAAMITAHLQRQERRAQEARARGSGRSRRHDYAAIEEEQLAEAIRLSMLEDGERKQREALAASKNTPSTNVSQTAAVNVAGPSQPRMSTDSYGRGIGSVPIDELIYAPPPDSYDARHSQTPSRAQLEDIE